MSSVKVTIINGKGLASMDSNGFSDPYVVIMLNGGDKHKTNVIKKTLDPEWNQTFNYKLPDDGPALLKLEVWDWDLAASDDFLGEAFIDLRTATNGSTVNLNLAPQEGATDQDYVTGTISAKIEIVSSLAAEQGKLKISTAALGKMKQELSTVFKEKREFLDLGSYFLPSVPKLVTEQYVFLKKIDLSFNNLFKIPDFANLTKLEELDFTGNSIDTIGPEIGSLTNLKILLINGNALTSISPAIGKLLALEKLEAKNNSLTGLPKEIGRLSNLEELWLSGNPIESIPPSVGAMRNLRTLDLNCCRLKEIPDEVTLASRLMDLNLGNNEISALPEGIGFLTRLITLNIQNNHVKDLPISIGKCRSLGQIGYGINLSRNPIEDAEMIEKSKIGPDHLMDYLEKRYVMAGSPATLPCPMPRDLGEGPTPEWLKELIKKDEEEEQKKKASQPVAMTMDQKTLALKKWIETTINDTLKPRVALIKADVSSTPKISVVLDICYTIKDFKAEFDKLGAIVECAAQPPAQPAPNTPPLEILRGLTVAALTYIENALEAIVGALPKLDKINVVVPVVNAVNKIKASLA